MAHAVDDAISQPGNERRLRELEDKMNQLLKELKDLKDEQKKETKARPLTSRN